MTRGSGTATCVRSVLITLVILAALGAAASVASAAPTPFIVCNQYGGQAGPDIAGSVAVWTDNRNGNLDIYGKDLSTGKTYAICTQKAQQDNPTVTRRVMPSGKVHYIVAWVDKRNHPTGAPNDIYAKDITAGGKAVRLTGGATVKWFPDIVDHWVVWIEADDPAGPYRIRARDLVADKTYLLATSKTLSPAAIDRRTVGSDTVYTAVYASGDGDISGRDVPSGDPFLVSQNEAFEWMPDISHNRVVWWQEGRGIMLRNLKTETNSFVHAGSRPRISGEYVTWDGGGHGGSFVIDYKAGARIYVRNVKKMTDPISFGVKDQTDIFPAISGDRVVWESGPAKRVLTHIHIYGARLP